MTSLCPGHRIVMVSAILILSWFGPIVAEEGRSEPQIDALANRILQAVDARPVRPVECAQEPVQTNLSLMFCGRLPKARRKDFAGLQETVDRLMNQAGAVPDASYDDWHKSGRVFLRSYWLRLIRMHLRFDTASGLIHLDYPQQFGSCLDSKLPEGIPITPPVLIESTRAEPMCPPRSRIVDLAGTVVLQARVDENGSVKEMCILHTNQPNVGLEAAAEEAVRQWRYQPAMADGRPLAIVNTVYVDFFCPVPRR